MRNLDLLLGRVTAVSIMLPESRGLAGKRTLSIVESAVTFIRKK